MSTTILPRKAEVLEASFLLIVTAACEVERGGGCEVRMLLVAVCRVRDEGIRNERRKFSDAAARWGHERAEV